MISYLPFVKTDILWELSAEKHNDNHNILFEAAERFNKYGFAEKAIALYDKSFDKAPSPKPLDSLYARAFLYTNRGRNDDAISIWNQIIKSLSYDYGIREGESVIADLSM